MYLNFFHIFFQCCNLNNFGFNEYNFEKTSNRNTTIVDKNRQSLNKNNDINHQPTKKNTNLNYDIDKNLILEMETENRQTNESEDQEIEMLDFCCRLNP